MESSKDTIPSSSEFTLEKYSSCFENTISKMIQNLVLDCFNEYAEKIEQATEKNSSMPTSYIQSLMKYRNVKTSRNFFELIQKETESVQDLHHKEEAVRSKIDQKKERWIKQELQVHKSFRDQRIADYNEMLQEQLKHTSKVLRAKRDKEIHKLPIDMDPHDFCFFSDQITNATNVEIQDHLKTAKEALTNQIQVLQTNYEYAIRMKQQEAVTVFETPYYNLEDTAFVRKDMDKEITERWALDYNTRLEKICEDLSLDSDEEPSESENSVSEIDGTTTNPEDTATSSTASPLPAYQKTEKSL